MCSNFRNKATTLIVLVTIPGFMFGAVKAQSNPLWGWVMSNIVLILGVTAVLGVFASLYGLANAIIINNKRAIQRANGIEPEPVAYQPRETFIARWYRQSWNLVPIEKEADIQLDHDYDGIKELDNSLPPWWVYSFYLSIIVAIGYLYVYQFSDLGLSQQEEYEVAMIEGDRRKAEFAAMQANNIDETNLVALTDENDIAFGKKAYQINCVACHGAAGEGGVGPNLTDNYWLHGGTTANVFKSIKYGIPEKGMIAWKAQMQPATIHKIASYIKTLKGTNPPNPKDPQGTLYEEEQEDLDKATDK